MQNTLAAPALKGSTLVHRSVRLRRWLMPRAGRQPGCLHSERPISGLHLRKVAICADDRIPDGVYRTSGVFVDQTDCGFQCGGAGQRREPSERHSPERHRRSQLGLKQSRERPCPPHPLTANSVCRRNVSHEPLTSIPAKSATAASGVVPRPRRAGPPQQHTAAPSSDITAPVSSGSSPASGGRRLMPKRRPITFELQPLRATVSVRWVSACAQPATGPCSSDQSCAGCVSFVNA